MDADLIYYRTLWESPSIEKRIQDGIQQHRMSKGALRIIDAQNRPIAGAEVQIEQISSNFRFGGNCFMLGSYPDEATNHAYENAFAGIFNSATVPFYWKGLEPELGCPRYSKNSEPLARRPPPDQVLEFCESRGLAPHGHTLVWDLAQWSVPDWLPDDPETAEPLWESHVREIAMLYGARIPRWDVLNEVVTGSPRHPRSRPMPKDYDLQAFRWAQKYFPTESEFWFNEVTECWTELRSSALAAIERLRCAGSRLDGIGLQFHLFQESDVLNVLRGLRFRPLDLLAALDAYASLKLPLHVSEITLPAIGNGEFGENLQAELARNFYRLWFSHPIVDAITWWNLPDGGAAAGEDRVLSGLIRKDLSAKPAYIALQNLILREWRTSMTTRTNALGEIRFQGFHGEYRILVDSIDCGSRLLNPAQPGTWEVKLER